MPCLREQRCPLKKPRLWDAVLFGKTCSGYKPDDTTYAFETNLSPRIEPIKRKMKNIRQKSDGSLKRIMPTMTVPTAPIPVHTAYAVPIGMTCVALLRK